MAILGFELLYLSLVAGILLAHKRDIVGGLLQDLRAGALVPVMHAEKFIAFLSCLKFICYNLSVAMYVLDLQRVVYIRSNL